MPDSRLHLVPAVDRAIRMLTQLRQTDDGKRISDLARDLDIPKSSAFQIAATLVHHRLLERDDETRRYRLGPGLQRIASSRRVEDDLPVLAAVYLDDLARSTRMTALLGIRVEEGVVLAAKVESPAPIDVSAPLGYRLNARAGVFGKLFAAALPAAELENFLSEPIPAFTTNSIVDADAYRRDLCRVRERGYAVDVEEYLSGVTAVGAPVRDRDGTVVGALCLLGLAAATPLRRLSTIGEQARAAAGLLSRDLGLEAPRWSEPTADLPAPGEVS